MYVCSDLSNISPLNIILSERILYAVMMPTYAYKCIISACLFNDDEANIFGSSKRSSLNNRVVVAEVKKVSEEKFLLSPSNFRLAQKHAMHAGSRNRFLCVYVIFINTHSMTAASRNKLLYI